jgi:L-alanine-DL-glutamate epimerase-like enolase superfamily enzyme
MNTTRRGFLAATTGVAAFSILPSRSAPAADKTATDEALEQAGSRPVLDLKDFKEPVIIESMELLKKGKEHFLRVRAKNGAEGIALDNGRMDILHPILSKLLFPYFIGKDARQLEEHLFEAYRFRDNYKFQGLALWVPIALIEFAILDLLGRIAKKSIADLLGGTIRTSIPFYVASGRRDTTPDQEIVYLRSLVEKTGAHAIKYRLGGRMSRNADAMPGRTEKLIPLTRKAFGDKMAIHGDANSSYDDVKLAIKVGRMMEDIGALFYEEPCPFDNFEATKKVADALTIPVALGEQEFSHWRFQEQISRRVADIAQPDLFYYGGMIRSMRVARMAELRDMPTAVHLSGGFGFVYSLQFCACAKYIGPWQEYKQGVETYGQWFDPPLTIKDGAISIPKGPGVGITDPKEVLKGALPVTG